MPIWLPARTPTGQIRIEYADESDARKNGYETRIVTIDLMTCCHCGRDFKVSRRSNVRRGFCLRHNAVTCGDPRCDRCVGSRQRKKASVEA